MTTKTKNIIGWTLSGLALNASAIDKIVGSEDSLQMATSFGLSGLAFTLFKFLLRLRAAPKALNI